MHLAHPHKSSPHIPANKLLPQVRVGVLAKQISFPLIPACFVGLTAPQNRQDDVARSGNSLLPVVVYAAIWDALSAVSPSACR